MAADVVQLPTSRTPRRRRVTVAQAVAKGDARGILVALRDRAARALDDPKLSGAPLAAMMNQFQSLSRQLEALDEKARDGEGDDEQQGDVPDDGFDPSTL